MIQKINCVISPGTVKVSCLHSRHFINTMLFGFVVVVLFKGTVHKFLNFTVDSAECRSL